VKAFARNLFCQFAADKSKDSAGAKLANVQAMIHDSGLGVGQVLISDGKNDGNDEGRKRDSNAAQENEFEMAGNFNRHGNLFWELQSRP
jgi:hypothetical protein